MAAVRRSSDSGVIVALVIFLILAVVCLAGAIWSYQQFSQAQAAIADGQGKFSATVEQAFKDSGWALSTTNRAFGVRYGQEAYEEVAQKVRLAAEYENAAKGVLGWDSVEGMQASLADAAIQKQAAAEGTAAYSTISALLSGYDDAYQNLTRRVAELSRERDALSTQLQDANAKSVAEQRRLGSNYTAKISEFQQTLDGLRAANQDLEKRVAQHRQEAVAWQQKYQDEVDARRTGETELQAQAAAWRQKYEDAVAPPGKGKRLKPDGEVLEVNSQYAFAVIEGGEDRGYSQDEKFVVFKTLPDGQNVRKGTVLIGQVKSHTSVVTVLDERGGYIVVGDSVVSLERWKQFHRYQLAAQQK